jgi:3,4-dihydroxy 2-butanone 4-phosphate synthase/GTP cyclohydrolase II
MDLSERIKRVKEALREFKEGGMLVVTDNEDRENEGDLIVAASKITPAQITFMARHGCGLICLAAEGERLDELDIPPMVPTNSSKMATAFTLSIDAIEGTTTGISASDRALTIQKFVAADTRASDFARPGHVFPLRAAPGGVLERDGHTEAAVDLAKLAELPAAGVICEIMNEDGTMARRPQLEIFCKEHHLKMISIEDLIAYRKSLPPVEKTAPKSLRSIRHLTSTNLPTRFGDFHIHLYKGLKDGAIHIALVKGRPEAQQEILTRIHSECLTGDLFHSRRCDCGEQLEAAMSRIEKRGEGIILYLRQEGRGIGLLNKILAYRLQQLGRDTVEANLELGFDADQREYSIAAEILADFGIKEIALMTNNPEKVRSLSKEGISVRQLSLEVEPNQDNYLYQKTKYNKMGHSLSYFEASKKEPSQTVNPMLNPKPPTGGKDAKSH